MQPRDDTDLAEPGRARERGTAWAGLLGRSRVLVGVLLAVAALAWALLRGISFYGLSPAHLVYDLDQPPWLLLLVSGWLAYRSRGR